MGSLLKRLRAWFASDESEPRSPTKLPRVERRDHLWDEMARMEDPAAEIVCVYCFTTKTPETVLSNCPGSLRPAPRELQ